MTKLSPTLVRVLLMNKTCKTFERIRQKSFSCSTNQKCLKTFKEGYLTKLLIAKVKLYFLIFFSLKSLLFCRIFFLIWRWIMRGYFYQESDTSTNGFENIGFLTLLHLKIRYFESIQSAATAWAWGQLLCINGLPPASSQRGILF